MNETVPTLSPVRPVRRILVSVYEKGNVAAFAGELARLGAAIVSTGGTATHLAEHGIAVEKVEQLTGFPPILGGRVKTLHPGIFGGLLADTERPEHAADLASNRIAPFDLVAVDLYPFEETVARGGSLPEAIEKIDIGGVAMIRAAAKNHRRVVVLVDAGDYEPVLAEIRETGGTSLATRERLAVKAFSRTASYDAAIAAYLARTVGDDRGFPDRLFFGFEKVSSLRYGENPHQRAALYRDPSAPLDSLASFAKLQGKELSFNNLLDIDSAVCLARDFAQCAAVIVKHNNPCGAAVGDNLTEAFGRAFACDPLAAFGGIIALRGVVDEPVAAAVLQHFVEVVAADDFTDEARRAFTRRPNIRLLRLPVSRAHRAAADWKRIDGGLLLQDPDIEADDPERWRVVSRRRPSLEERASLDLAWRVARRVKSNAIVLANDRQTVGIGAGQMSRVDACRLAVTKPVLPIAGCGAASDAFFPFRDGLDVLADAGVTAVVAPGGSVRDQEVIAAADERHLAFVVAPRRHFRH
jgi:phosphoribosylaminoimidazolecarboxamide formyltransferase / IMP cyclohydrolase